MSSRLLNVVFRYLNSVVCVRLSFPLSSPPSCLPKNRRILSTCDLPSSREPYHVETAVLISRVSAVLEAGASAGVTWNFYFGILLTMKLKLSKSTKPALGRYLASVP